VNNELLKNDNEKLSPTNNVPLVSGEENLSKSSPPIDSQSMHLEIASLNGDDETLMIVCSQVLDNLDKNILGKHLIYEIKKSIPLNCIPFYSNFV